MWLNCIYRRTSRKLICKQQLVNHNLAKKSSEEFVAVSAERNNVDELIEQMTTTLQMNSLLSNQLMSVDMSAVSSGLVYGELALIFNPYHQLLQMVRAVLLFRPSLDNQTANWLPFSQINHQNWIAEEIVVQNSAFVLHRSGMVQLLDDFIRCRLQTALFQVASFFRDDDVLFGGLIFPFWPRLMLVVDVESFLVW